MIGLILDHIWQSTLFVAGARLLMLLLQANGARVRYGIWLSASLKFLFPLSLLTASGTALSNLLPSQLPATPITTILDGATQPFSIDTGRIVQTAMASPQSWDWGAALALIWFVGFVWIATQWLRRWLNLRAVVRSAIPFTVDAPLPVKLSPALLEPGLIGIFNPVVLLPTGITNRLSKDELDAVIAHELCHWRRRDNLTAALHMLVEVLFWFHPLVWWLETKLIAERERACDEAVLGMGRDTEVYAESILKVCKFYVRSPLPCAAGISSSDLKPRLERIIQNRAALRLNVLKKVLLVTVPTIAVVVPLLVGFAGSRQAQAAESLNGWGPFKFGMTPDQVRALPPPAGTWFNLPSREFAYGVTSSFVGTRGFMQVFGTRFHGPGFGFGQNDRLQFISFWGIEYSSAEACKASFNKIMTALEAQYGPFGPGYRNVKGAMLRTIGTKSQYQYAAGPDDGPDSYWEDARLVRGGHYLDIRHSHRTFRGKQGCMTDITFSADSPQAPNAPVYSRR